MLTAILSVYRIHVVLRFHEKKTVFIFKDKKWIIEIGHYLKEDASINIAKLSQEYAEPLNKLDIH